MTEILFPVLTSLTLVFAGILVGYFLWFQDRTENQESRERLSSENEHLKVEIQDHSSRIRSLEAQLSDLEASKRKVDHQCDELKKNWDRSLEHADQLQSELDSARKKLQLANEQIAAECLKRTNSEEKLIAAKQEFLDYKSHCDTELQDRFNSQQTQLIHAQHELQRMTLINGQLEQKLQDTNSDNAKLNSELVAQRDILETAKSNAAGLEKEYVSAETRLRGQIELLKESRGQAAAAISAKDIAELALNESREHAKTLHQKLESLESENRENHKYKERCEHLELSMALIQERVDSLLAQRDDFGAKQKQLEMEVVALQNRNGNQLATIEQLRAQSNATDERRQKNHKKLLDDIEKLKSEIVDFQSTCDSLETQLAEADQWKQKNENSLKKISEENAQLIAKVSEFEKIDQDAIIESEQYKARIASVMTQRDSAMTELQKIQGDMKKLRGHAKSNEETIRTLRRERGAILMRNREFVSASYPRIHSESLEFSKADQISSEYGGTVKLDPVRGPVFVEPPRQRDDLKKIYGIAKVLEDRLNGFGIYTYKQIMDWNDKAINEFSELLAFKDRIRRDDWKGQAAQLYQQKSKSAA